MRDAGCKHDAVQDAGQDAGCRIQDAPGPVQQESGIRNRNHAILIVLGDKAAYRDQNTLNLPKTSFSRSKPAAASLKCSTLKQSIFTERSGAAPVSRYVLHDGPPYAMAISI
jgi:hypothetical protein